MRNIFIKLSVGLYLLISVPATKVPSMFLSFCSFMKTVICSLLYTLTMAWLFWSVYDLFLDSAKTWNYPPFVQTDFKSNHRCDTVNSFECFMDEVLHKYLVGAILLVFLPISIIVYMYFIGRAHVKAKREVGYMQEEKKRGLKSHYGTHR